MTWTSLLLLLSLLAGGSPGTPETQNAARLTGVVRDATGLSLPGAMVELRLLSQATAIRTAVTGADGTFLFETVPAGAYRLRVAFPGLAAAEQTVTVDAETPAPIAIVLAAAGIEEEVSVRGQLPPAAPTLHSEVDRQLIEALPSESVSAGLSSIITLTAPGVAADSNGTFHPLGEHAETSFSIDGQPITDQQGRTFSNQLPASAIESLDIQTGVPAPEFGDKTSLVARASTRSGLGTRRLRGSVSASYGSFRSPTASFALGGGTDRVGNFLALDAAMSDRFLDAPEPVALHDRGTSFSLFDRLDWHRSAHTDLQLNVFAARSRFETPNTFDQEDAGQEQQQRQWSANIAPSLRHVFSSQTTLEVNGWVRHDNVEYLGSANPFADRPAMLAQHRTLTNAGGKAVLSWRVGTHSAKVGVQATSTGLRERFQTGLTDPAFNTPCFSRTGDPVADTSLRDPNACASRGFESNPDFLPALLPFDLTRGGSLFTFDEAGRVNQWTAYAQDEIRRDPWTVMIGARLDRYDGLSRATDLQPRAGVVYRVGRTRTSLRASYGRILLTPYNENLVLASSTGSGGFGGGILGAKGGAPLIPATRHQYDLGVTQTIWRGVQIDGEYFWKLTDDPFDFDVILNTPLAIPVQFRKSRIDGGLVRVTLPDLHGWRAYATLSHTKSLLYGPELGGLRFSATYAAVAAPDHDQPFAANTHLDFHGSGRFAPWGGFTWRYDSGLVAVAVPTYADALRLTGDAQAAMGLHCGDVLAAPGRPLRSCAPDRIGSTRLNIPAAGTEDEASNPARIAPHQLVDVAAGLDRLTIASVPFRVRLTVVNLFDTSALYNFLSTFSGTHFVTPRTIQLQLTIPF